MNDVVIVAVILTGSGFVGYLDFDMRYAAGVDGGGSRQRADHFHIFRIEFLYAGRYVVPHAQLRNLFRYVL